MKITILSGFKTFLFTIIILLANISFAGKDAHNIKITVHGISNAKCQLAYHYGDKKYLQIDSIWADKNGTFTIKGDEKLLKGIYLVVLPNKSYFEILIGDQQKFTVETDTIALVEKMKIVGSEDNELFYSFLQFWTQQHKDSRDLKTSYERLTKIESPSEKQKDSINNIKTTLNNIDQSIKNAQLKIIQDHPNLFYAKVLNAMREPEVPEAPKDKDGNVIDSMFTYKYYKTHFWDHIDLQEEGLARTPIIQGKMDKYMNQLTVQVPDSLNASADVLLQKAKGNKEIMKYCLVNLLNTYANSNIMGMDAVYVHLVDNYYAKGDAFWADSTSLYRIKDHANTLRPLLIGKEAINMVLKNTDGQYISMHDVATKHDYTILFFWDPDCGHCKKAVPKLNEAYKNLKSKKFNVVIYAACVEIEEDKWKNFVKSNDLKDWINVADIDRHSYFRSQYDISSTPKVFIVDKNKKIIAKRLGVEQIEDFLTRYDKNKGSVGIIQMKEDSEEH